ncbi:hypothetical protein F53441_11309 [Fusarium austroafricanum]|uniref:Uncharacterized protein n=1 Tax=Fusarium austroafricanum TaxID=2364996 RepID=A0A8H4NQG6_9HYPO|nr:hypothetical protein F53441_11309 [Fusarium austroafricanum]
MLRVRRKVGSPAGFAHICRPYLRCPRQSTPFRSFATETSPDDASKPSSTSKADAEQILKQLRVSSDKLNSRIKKLEKDVKGEESQSQKKKQNAAKSKAKAPKKKSNKADISEALAVAKRVYGVDQLKKSKRKKKGPKPSSPRIQNVQQAANGANSPETTSWAAGQQAGTWTSLREKLQGGSATKFTNALNTTQEDFAASFLDHDQHIITNTQMAESRSKVEPSTERVKASKRRTLPVHTINPQEIQMRPVEEESRRPVPVLAHRLDKVLFNDGPYQLQDKRTLVYNFDPYLASIMPIEEFDFNALKEYVTSSKDNRLTELCLKYGKKYSGSTSSMTALLSHFHFLLSAWRRPNFDHLSRAFEVEYTTFTGLTRGPAAAFARFNDGAYAIDADKEFDSASVLSMLGKSMEKLLTLPKDHFEKYRKDRSHELSEEEKNGEESYHYTTMGDFMMRSQLDAHDPRLPGTGMFDLKTRAVVSIRMDVGGYHKGIGYEILDRFGTWESFEREYYDMIRAAFLKYSLQVRMGRMDGIFVAFHNTQRIFGFQYISLEEMDVAMHGTANRKVGDQEFKVSIKLLNDLLDRAAERFPKKSLRLHIETRPTNPPLTYFFAEPVDDKEIQETQEKGKAAVDRFEKEILGISRGKQKADEARLSEELASQADDGQENSNDSQTLPSIDKSLKQKSWDEMMAKVDQTVEDDAAGLESVREALEEALEQSGLLAGKSEQERDAYLTELVEALAKELKIGRGGGSEVEESEQTETASDESQEVTQSSSEAGEYSVDVDPSVEAESVLSRSDAESGTSTANLNIDHIQDVPAVTVDEAAVESIISSTDDTPTDTSLKDLILKVAQDVDNKTSNLGTFEQVLSKLVQDQKELSSEIEEMDTTNVDDIPTETIKTSEKDKSSLRRDAQMGTGNPEKEILGLYVTVRNIVNGQVAERLNHSKSDEVPDWKVEYMVTELPSHKARLVLKQIKERRKKSLTMNPDYQDMNWYRMWGGSLPKRTAAGRKYRRLVLDREKRAGVKVAWHTGRIRSHRMIPSAKDSNKTHKEASDEKTPKEETSDQGTQTQG